jgi:toxin ParE1/3/4
MERKTPAREILRTPRARLDLVEIWSFIADDNEAAADRVLDRIQRLLEMLADNPHAGRARPELSPDLRSIITGNYVLYYTASESVIVLIRARSRYMDTQSDDVS